MRKQQQQKSKKPECVGTGKITPVQVAFIVDRYLSDNAFTQTSSSFRSEASHLISKSPVREAPKSLMTLGDILEEYVTLKEKKLFVERERCRLEQENVRVKNFLDVMHNVMTAYNAAGPNPVYTPSPQLLPPAVASGVRPQDSGGYWIMESATKLFEQRNAEKLKAREKLRAGKKKKYSPGPEKILTTELTNHASVLQPPASGGSLVPGGSLIPNPQEQVSIVARSEADAAKRKWNLSTDKDRAPSKRIRVVTGSNGANVNDTSVLRGMSRVDLVGSLESLSGLIKNHADDVTGHVAAFLDLEEFDTIRLKEEIKALNAKLVAREAEVAKLKSERVLSDKKLEKEKIGHGKTEKAWSLITSARAKMAETLLSKAKTIRSDAVKDFLKSDSYYFLSKMQEGDVRGDAFFDCVSQLKDAGFLNDSITSQDANLKIMGNCDGEAVFDPKLKSPDALASDEFWSVVAPLADFTVDESPVYPSWLPDVFYASKIGGGQSSNCNAKWMDLPGPILDHEPATFLEEVEGKKVTRCFWKKSEV